MDRINAGRLKKQAASILSDRREDYRRLVLLHAAVSVGYMLLVSVIGFFLNRAMADNQGLSGMANTAVLQTVQAVLNTAGTVLLPFWQMGILYTSIRVARRQHTEFSMLTRGFQRWGVIVRHFLLFFLILLAVAMVCMQALSILITFLPTPPAIAQALQGIDPDVLMDPNAMMPAVMEALAQVPKGQLLVYFVPVVLIYVMGYGTLLVLIYYRLRMSQYLLMDEPGVGVFAAMKQSNRMTKGEKANLFKLDLSFWWYFLLQLGISAITYIPDVLRALGITLPMNQNTANLLFYAIYCVAFLALSWFVGAYYQTTMACAYEALKPRQEA